MKRERVEGPVWATANTKPHCGAGRNEQINTTQSPTGKVCEETHVYINNNSGYPRGQRKVWMKHKNTKRTMKADALKTSSTMALRV